MRRFDLSSEMLTNQKLNFFIRQSVSLFSLGVHLNLFWSQLNFGLLLFLSFQTLLYPYLMLRLSTPSFLTKHSGEYLGANKCETTPSKNHFFNKLSPILNGQFGLRCDIALYGICLGLWGYNPFLCAIYIAATNIISSAAGGIKTLSMNLAIMAAASLMGNAALGFYFRGELPLAALVFASLGLIAFTSFVGFRLFRINSRLRSTRTVLEAKHHDLKNISALALAVNEQLDINTLMQTVMHTFERLFPFESLYMLTYTEDQTRLQVVGVYGSVISQKEYRAFLDFEFDLANDKDSIFVKALDKNKVVHIPDMNETLSKQAAKVDQDLFNIKPSISVAYFPILVHESVVGGACFINYKHHFYLNGSDIERIQSYLVQVGTALRNVRMVKELKSARDQAEQAQAKAEASEEAKSRFLANMSHEIRTPMTAILGFSDALQDNTLTEKERSAFLGHIQRSGQHLLSMINDILDISKIEASKIEIERIDCDIVEIICDINSYMLIKTQTKSLLFEIELVYPLPRIFICDPTRLKQILLNLCNNAVKFTEKGGVRLRVKVDHSKNLIFEIQDSGIGISPQDQKRIFRAFDQADTSTTRLYGGTGLGLYISQSLARLLDGELTLESTLGTGTTFILGIPASGDSPKKLLNDSEFKHEMELIKQSKTHETAPLLHGRILLAEDVVENQKLVSRLLSQMGLDVTLVDNGKKAFEAAKEHRFDLIIMDIQMPVMDGKQAIKLMRSHNVACPIIAFTANVMKHQRDEYLSLGFNDILEKPIIKNNLFSKIATHIKPIAQEGNQKVLVVEDNEVNQLIIQRHIQTFDNNIHIDIVNNGQQALDLEGKNIYNLILMDIHMPVLNGLEATRYLRAHHCRSPIYIVSGNTQADDIKMSMDAGATGHLAKPIDKSEIESILQRHIVRPIKKLEDYPH